MRIVINGGHCLGKDPGAVGAVYQEADICRQRRSRHLLMPLHLASRNLQPYPVSRERKR